MDLTIPAVSLCRAIDATIIKITGDVGSMGELFGLDELPTKVILRYIILPVSDFLRW